MSIHLIIDGYNLIRQSGRLSLLDRQDMKAGREALIEALAKYKKIKHHKITVVFDGANAPSFVPSRDYVKGIRIKFSRLDESADTVIKKMAAREREKAVIVTSDRDIINQAESSGSASISSLHFEEKMIRSIIGISLAMRSMVSLEFGGKNILIYPVDLAKRIFYIAIYRNVELDRIIVDYIDSILERGE